MTPDEALKWIAVASAIITGISGVFYQWIYKPIQAANKMRDEGEKTLRDANKAKDDTIALLKGDIERLHKETDRLINEHQAELMRLITDHEAEKGRNNKSFAETLSFYNDQLVAVREDNKSLRDELSSARTTIEASDKAKLRDHAEILELQKDNVTQKSKQEWLSGRVDELTQVIDKQAELHEQDLTRINNKTANQLAKMQVETAGLKDLYIKVEEDLQRKGKEMLELNAKLDNFTKAMKQWGLTDEQIVGIASGILDPAAVEPIIDAEIKKHLCPPETIPAPEPKPNEAVTSPPVEEIKSSDQPTSNQTVQP